MNDPAPPKKRVTIGDSAEPLERGEWDIVTVDIYLGDKGVRMRRPAGMWKTAGSTILEMFRTDEWLAKHATSGGKK